MSRPTRFCAGIGNWLRASGRMRGDGAVGRACSRRSGVWSCRWPRRIRRGAPMRPPLVKPLHSCAVTGTRLPERTAYSASGSRRRPCAAVHRIVGSVKPARRSFVEACSPRTSSYPCRLMKASTPSCMRTRRQERRLALGSFYSVGRSRRPSPTANASEPACLPADVVASASRPQHGARWHDPWLAVAPARDQELARQRDNPNPAQP